MSRPFDNSQIWENFCKDYGMGNEEEEEFLKFLEEEDLNHDAMNRDELVTAYLIFTDEENV